MQTQSFTLFADYFQFYLLDEQIAPDAPTDYTDEDIDHRIKTAPHIVVVQPIRNLTVPVTLEVHEAEPPCDSDAWDHIAECSLDLPSGKLQVHECTGGPVAHLSVSPGPYRVRALFAHLDSLDDTGLKGDDQYTLHLWPAPISDLRIIKRWLQ